MDTRFVADLTLVGRKAEREALQVRWAAAVAGDPRLVLIEGESGMGRTTLLRAFLAEAEGRGRVLHARCVPVQRAAYGPLADLLAQLLDCEPAAPDQELAWALADRLAALPGLAARRHLVAHVMRLEDPAAPGDLGAEALRQAALAAVCDLFELSARDCPFLITVEDLHWADPGTAAWLSMFCRRLAMSGGGEVPVALVGTALLGGLEAPLADLAAIRPVGAGCRFEVATLKLGPLSMPEAVELAGRRIGQKAATWSPGLRNLMKQVLDRAAGHPAYVVETVSCLVAAGTIAKGEGGWDVRVAGEIDLPSSVSAAIAARLQTLPGELRDKLQLAAVAGARFDAQQEGAEIGGEIAESLEELVRLRLLSYPKGAAISEKERDVAYQAIDEDRRRELHLEVGEALEALAGPLAPRFAGELAEHFSHARDALRAYRYTCMLAERARETDLAGDACRWYSAALIWAPHIEEWDETLPPAGVARLRLAQAQIQLGHFEEALATLDALAQDEPLSAEAWRTRGLALERHGNMLSSLEAAEQACRRSGGDELEAGRSMLALGDAQRRVGKLAEAVVSAQNALTLLGPAATTAEQAMAHGLLGICYRRLGDLERAEAEHRQSLAIRERACDLEGVANSLNNVGIIATDQGRFAEGEKAFGESLALFCRLGNQPGAAMVLNNLGDVYIKQGRLKEAEARLQEAQALAEQLGYASERVTTTANLAELWLARGNAPEALRLLERCLSLAVRAGLREFLPEIHYARGRAHEKAGDHALASMSYQEACDLAENAGNEAFAIRMRTAIASLV